MANETGYEVQRKKKGASWTTVAAKGPDVTAHAETPDVKGNVSYRVRALGAGGNSAWSNVVTLKL